MGKENARRAYYLLEFSELNKLFNLRLMRCKSTRCSSFICITGDLFHNGHLNTSLHERHSSHTLYI